MARRLGTHTHTYTRARAHVALSSTALFFSECVCVCVVLSPRLSVPAGVLLMSVKTHSCMHPVFGVEAQFAGCGVLHIDALMQWDNLIGNRHWVCMIARSGNGAFTFSHLS